MTGFVAGITLLLAFAGVQVAGGTTTDHIVQTGKLVASDGAANDDVGISLAASADGTTLVSGAPTASIAAPDDGRGAVYVFSKPSGPWAGGTEVAKLTSSDAADYDNFGTAIAISGDGSTIAVGVPAAGGSTPNDGQGAVYVFSRPQNGWSGDLSPSAKLTASDGAAQDRLGTSVAVSGDGSTIAAGAYAASVHAPGDGAAYVFTKPAGGWSGAITETSKLTEDAASANTDDGLGSSIAISGDGSTVFAGSPFNTPTGGKSSQGAIYVFVRGSSDWPTTGETEAATLTASNPSQNDSVGGSVSVSPDGSTLAAGSQISSAGLYSGGVYVFEEPAGGWADENEAALLTASDGDAGDLLGGSVAITPDGGTIVGGAAHADVAGHADQGAAYVFEKPASGWGDGNEDAKLTSGDGAANDRFGSATAAAGDLIAESAEGATVGSNDFQGALYTFAGSTATTVGCDPATVTVGQPATCTATVTDTSVGKRAPAGTVAFTSDSSGAFDTASCALAPTAIAGASSCHVTYTPTAAGKHALQGAYGGAAGTQPSQGQTSVMATAAATTSTTPPGAGGPAPPKSSPPPTPKPKPKLTLTAAAKQRIARKRAIFVIVRANQAGRLVTKATLSITGVARTIRLPAVTRALAANKTVKVKLTVSRKVAAAIHRALKRHRKVTATVTVTFSNANGKASATRRIRATG
jgi:hypothetical protein